MTPQTIHDILQAKSAYLRQLAGAYARDGEDRKAHMHYNLATGVDIALHLLHKHRVTGEVDQLFGGYTWEEIRAMTAMQRYTLRRRGVNIPKFRNGSSRTKGGTS